MKQKSLMTLNVHLLSSSYTYQVTNKQADISTLPHFNDTNVIEISLTVKPNVSKVLKRMTINRQMQNIFIWKYTFKDGFLSFQSWVIKLLKILLSKMAVHLLNFWRWNGNRNDARSCISRRYLFSYRLIYVSLSYMEDYRLICTSWEGALQQRIQLAGERLLNVLFHK